MTVLAVVLLLIGSKCLLVFLWSKWLLGSIELRPVDRVLLAWLIVQGLQLLGILSLSCCNSLTIGAYRLWWMLQLVAALVVAGGIQRKTARVDQESSQLGSSRSASRFPVVPVALAVVFLVLATIRSLYFFDTTYHSYTYGLPRIAYFMQRSSVFAYESGFVLKMHCNEWNTELNAMHYVLLSGQDRFLMLAGLESFAVFTLAVYSLATGLGATRMWATWITILIASSPIVFTMAGVIKGDLPAAAAVTAGLALIVSARSMKWPWACYLFGLAWIGYGAGCKATVIPFFGLLGIALAAYALLCREARELPVKRWVIILAVLLVFVFASRHATNTVQFGNPVKRIPWEAEVGRFSWANWKGASEEQVKYFLGLGPDTTLDTRFRPVLCRGWGMSGLATLAVLGLGLGTLTLGADAPKEMPSTTWLVRFILVGLAVTWFYATGLVPVAIAPEFREYLARFFLAFTVPFAVIGLVWASRYLGDRAIWAMGSGFTLAVLANGIMGFCPSEIMFIKGLSQIPTHIAAYDDFSAKMLVELDEGYASDLGALAELRGKEQRILVAAFDDNTPVFQLFGANREWRVDFALSVDDLEQQLDAKDDYDWIALRASSEENGQSAWDNALRDRSYAATVLGKWWVLWQCKQ